MRPLLDAGRGIPYNFEMARLGHGLGSVVVDGRVYVLSGGPTPGGSFSDTNEVFIPAATDSGGGAK